MWYWCELFILKVKQVTTGEIEYSFFIRYSMSH